MNINKRNAINVHTDFLHELIHSLSKSEKRYFQLINSTQKGSDDYMKLFGILCQLPDYNHTKVSTAFPGKTGKQIIDTKDYLQRLVLRSLRIFQCEKSDWVWLVNRIQEIDILIDKGFNTKAERLIGQAKQRARKVENETLFLELGEREKRLFRSTNYRHIPESRLDHIYRGNSRSIRKIKSGNEYWIQYGRIHIIISNSENIRDKEIAYRMDKYVSSPFFRYETIDLSSASKLQYHYILSAYHFIRKDYHAAYLQNNARLEIMESDNFVKKRNTKRYINTVSNIVLCHYRMKRLVEANTWLEIMGSIQTTTVDEERFLFERYETFVLQEHLITGKIKAGITHRLSVENKMNEFGPLLSERYQAGLYWLFAMLYYSKGDIAMTLKYTYKVLNLPSHEDWEGLYSCAKIAVMLFHYESKHYDIIPYLGRTVYRYLKRKERLYELERIMLELIRDLNQEDQGNIHESRLYQECKNKLLLIAHDEHEQNALQYFDFLAWVESKLTKTSYRSRFLKNLENQRWV